MPQDPQIEIIEGANEAVPTEAALPPNGEQLATKAAELSQLLAWNPSVHTSHFFSVRWNAMASVLRPTLKKIEATPTTQSDPDDLRWLRENLHLLWSELWNTRNAFRSLKRLPNVQTPGNTIPRAAAVAESYLCAVNFRFSEESFLAYLTAFQQQTALRYRELWALLPAMELVLLEQVAIRARKFLRNSEPAAVGVCVHSLREINQIQWKEALESQVAFESILRQDPVGSYADMDFESRNLYREKIVRISERADMTEVEVAREALTLARRVGLDSRHSRLTARESHIGYYLVGQGVAELRRRAGFRPSLIHHVRGFLHAHPDEFYLPGIEVLTFGIMSAVVLMLTSTVTALSLISFAMLVLLIPCSQSAVQLMNYLTTALLRPEILPKLDFSHAISEKCTTLVAVPALLLNEKQVRQLVQNMEVRYLGNHDPNLHFALLTDLPDSPVPAHEDDPLVDLCSQLIKELNEKYSGLRQGSFLLLHRYRIFNPREKVWMGWERKRGKLMDLGKLLKAECDSFPVKAGDISVLSQIRFVITLDADTELPRGAAHKLIGTLAHPLNQAVVDPEKNVVVAGYGILQPRVRVSVQSASRSRLANIYSGQTGFDIYTRAVSDVYQDLYGEGIFAGKGIYEVDTVHRVLEHRFPQNALLSHDLIEGAYARAGLVTDVEVIEDYPSHYSAYNRRKHRWLRGDWQITGWLLSRVRDEIGHKVANPISLVSQWKIFDNLRRSLVEPATFLLFVLGWLVLPGFARSWTIAAVVILFVPAWFEFLFTLVRSAAEKKLALARDAVSTLFTSNVSLVLNLAFLPHQTLVSLDAVARTLIRRLFTRQRLLEWETAAEAEVGGGRRTPVDTYLNWMPLIAVLLAAFIYDLRPQAMVAALPVLILWALSKPISIWLNLPPRPSETEVSEKDKRFLRTAALRTWQFFSEFSTQEHNWLIPDNVQEEPYVVAARVSPTNIGLLLNARQAACELGYLTAPEFADQTARTLATMRRMKRHRGHLFNWYDTHTLAPLPPRFVSTVDSGNLAASLWTLQQGCESLLERPVVHTELAVGFLDYLRIMTEWRAFPHRLLTRLAAKTKTGNFARTLLKFPDSALHRIAAGAHASEHSVELSRLSRACLERLCHFRYAVTRFAPWMLPDFAELRHDSRLDLPGTEIALKDLPEILTRLETRLQAALASEAESAVENSRGALLGRLLSLVSGARMDSANLIQQLQALAADAEREVSQMDFAFLWSERRRLMSIGFEADKKELHSACYDLLASEARIAVFVAIAKDDIPQETWFRLGRTHITDRGRPVLLSWTGTMFEYLMPSLWMHTYHGTLLDRSRHAAVLSQQEYAAAKQVPWGVSESAFATRDDAGNYGYHAFGVPQLALHRDELDALVISPYSTFLALNTDAAAAIKNLRTMSGHGWLAANGFYESADYSGSQNKIMWRHSFELVRCWMAHHQGMSLLALANFLQHGEVQEWFHSHPRVQATELLLHEKPVNYTPANPVGA